MAALAVVEMVDENMANAARVHAIESGKTYEGRTLIAFGGGGPVHACRVAEKIGIDRILVPSGAGVGSAIGFLRAPVGYEVVRSLYQRFSSFDVGAVNALLAEMETEAMGVVEQGSFGAPTAQTRIAYMRYVGQAVTMRTQAVRDSVTGEVSPWNIYDRATLAPGARLAGPAIIAEDETSTLIGIGWTASINGLGYIELVRETV